ncbi:hypothetical protein B0H13DRAFT_1852318 [Mycena leptocephala]|nr:hypothetical protein B0H13DRAFT_1852318 [Mycena leptocephala]
MLVKFVELVKYCKVCHPPSSWLQHACPVITQHAEHRWRQRVLKDLALGNIVARSAPKYRATPWALRGLQCTFTAPYYANLETFWQLRAGNFAEPSCLAPPPLDHVSEHRRDAINDLFGVNPPPAARTVVIDQSLLLLATIAAAAVALFCIEKRVERQSGLILAAAGIEGHQLMVEQVQEASQDLLGL